MGVRKTDKSLRAEPRPSLRCRESAIEGRPAPQVQSDPCPEGTWKKLSMPRGRLVGTGRGPGREHQSCALDKRGHSPSNSSLSSRRASFLSRRSCLSISALMRCDSFSSADRQQQPAMACHLDGTTGTWSLTPGRADYPRQMQGLKRKLPELTVVWSKRLRLSKLTLSRSQFRGPASPERLCGPGSDTQSRAWEGEKSELGGVSGAVCRRRASPDTVAGYLGRQVHQKLGRRCHSKSCLSWTVGCRRLAAAVAWLAEKGPASPCLQSSENLNP